MNKVLLLFSVFLGIQAQAIYFDRIGDFTEQKDGFNLLTKGKYESWITTISNDTGKFIGKQLAFRVKTSDGQIVANGKLDNRGFINIYRYSERMLSYEQLESLFPLRITVATSENLFDSMEDPNNVVKIVYNYDDWIYKKILLFKYVAGKLDGNITTKEELMQIK